MSLGWGGEAVAARRLSQPEVEHKLIETAKDLIHDHGLTVSLEHLRLDSLMERAGVPKTSFYRVWGSKEEFFSRLLEELVLPSEIGGAAFDPSTVAAVEDTVRRHADRLDTPEGRTSVVREAVRVGAEQNYQALRESRLWKTYTAVTATVEGMAPGEQRERVEAALRVAEEHFVDRMADLYEQMLGVMQYRLRPGFTMRQLATLGASVVEGLVRREVVVSDHVAERVPGPAIDGGTTEWHLAAFGFLQIVEAMAEPIDT